MLHYITSIPVFDGKNIPLKDFIQDIPNADADIPDAQKGSFIKKVLSKLRGSARNSTVMWQNFIFYYIHFILILSLSIQFYIHFSHDY